MGKYKNIKKITVLSVIFIIILFLSSCKSENPININLKDLCNVIGEKFDLTNTVESDPDQIQNYYGITPDDTVQIIVLKELNVNSAEGLILIEATDKDKAKEIENKLKEYKTYKLNELRDYTLNPDNENQYYIVDGADITVNQQFVFWAVYTQSKEINDIIKDYIKNSK